MRDIIITLPAKINWENYVKELKTVEDGSQVMNFKVPFLPKETKIGNKCYLCWRGKIVGWMKIVGFIQGGFTCTTTGKYWEGNFIQRSGEFTYLNEPIPMKGFQGFRYYKD